MNRAMRVILGFLVVGAVGVAVAALSLRYTAGAWGSALTQAAFYPFAVDALILPPALIAESLPIRRRDTLAALLERAGVDQTTKAEMIAAVEGTFDVRKLRAGSQLTLTRSQAGTLESLEYIIDPDRKLQLLRSDRSFAATVIDIPGIIRTVPVCGTIQGSLFESIERTGERAELTLRIADIFAWDLDFYTDPREGDEFCVLVEKKEYANGQPSTYRRILAAKYNNAGTLYDAYLFPGEDGKPRYYSSDGSSLQSAFLRSPMKFEARISSRFSYRRLHPILKIRRPHLGTDYAAPVGTQVQTVGAGRVVFSGRSGNAGNLIKIKHANGYETQYLHLSRMFVRKGQRVEQGQRIGLVGATGLATGPHLDFRFRRNGRFVDFERIKLPPAMKLSARQKDAFAAERDRLLALMESGSASSATVMASAESASTPASAP